MRVAHPDRIIFPSEIDADSAHVLDFIFSEGPQGVGTVSSEVDTQLNLPPYNKLVSSGC